MTQKKNPLDETITAFRDESHLLEGGAEGDASCLWALHPTPSLAAFAPAGAGFGDNISNIPEEEAVKGFADPDCSPELVLGPNTRVSISGATLMESVRQECLARFLRLIGREGYEAPIDGLLRQVLQDSVTEKIIKDLYGLETGEKVPRERVAQDHGLSLAELDEIEKTALEKLRR